MQYEREVRHDGLHKYRVVRGNTWWEAEAKAEAQLRAWDEQWTRTLQAEDRRREQQAKRVEDCLRIALEDPQERRQEAQRYKDDRKAEAERITGEAEALREKLIGILAHSLGMDDAIDWNQLVDTRAFPEPEPPKPPPPLKLTKPELRLPAEQPSNPGLLRRVLEGLVPSRREARMDREEAEYHARVLAAKRAYNEAIARYNEHLEPGLAKWQLDMAEWRKRREAFLAEQNEHNRKLADFARAYIAKDPEAISQYCELVLHRSEYPDFFPGNFDLQFNPDNDTLIVDLELPIPENIPSTKSARYVASRDEIQTREYSPAEKRKLYDEVIYQTALRTVHELYEADKAKALKSIVFNGRTRAIDKGTGKQVVACILSLQTTLEDFLQIDLAKVDPGKCIRKLRGVAASTLYDLTPVAPVLSINREDSRFVEGREVITNISGGDNLAAMDWEQFEHLIRELFEKEFAANGGEVRVTGASRDGGVDAIIFDPDPIRGGKYVVQAKRYTQLVPVSAVRDLYGTVVNEGAVKGILVTTAYYGPDSYSFAKDKPLTLLDGSNLLAMLQKHGVQAHIDIKAARKILGIKE